MKNFLADDLITGIDEIDEQHKQIFENTKNFGPHMTRENVISAITNMSSYIKKHSETEERYLENFGYPQDELQKHREHHQVLIDIYNNLLLEMASTSADNIKFKMRDQVLGWLKEHTSGHDLKSAKFFRNYLNNLKNIDIPEQ